MGNEISACLVEVIGRKKTLELFYTGKQINATEAQEIGLVNRVFSVEDFLDNVYGFALEIAQKNPTALSMGKDAMQMIRGLDFEKSLNYLRDQVLILGETKDSKEGMKAFLEKRKPVWSGR